MTTLRLEISDDLVREIDQLARRAGQDREEYIVKAIRQQVHLAKSVFQTRMTSEDLREVQRDLAGYARAAGYTSEEEILNDIS